MKISVFGCGYLGAVHAAAMASLGHQVVGIDVDKHKISALKTGEPYFYEPGLPDLLRSGLEQKKLEFSLDKGSAAGATLHFICVNTPQKDDSGATDMTYVWSALESILSIAKDGDVIVGKSTVPVGTAHLIQQKMDASGMRLSLIWNPESLREGLAVKDTLHPDRIVYGVGDKHELTDASKTLDKVYSALLAEGIPRVVMNFPSAELVKISANAFLATKISFINAVAEVCAVTGADVDDIADAIGLDDRIGRKFLNAGIGFGGGCLPKDIRAFKARSKELGSQGMSGLLEQVDTINLATREHSVQQIVELCGGVIKGLRVGILGLAFKPDSDDVRDSPALDIAKRLHELGATVLVHDPKAMANAKKQAPDLTYLTGATDVIQSADQTFVLVRWKEYEQLDHKALYL